jgi:hypothetical protein
MSTDSSSDVDHADILAALLVDAADDDSGVPTGGKATASKALALLEQQGYARRVSRREKRRIVIDFAATGIPIFGQAFDAIREVDGTMTLVEVKATSSKRAAADFGGHFFSVTTAEILVAQKLRDRYIFAFVNVATSAVMLLTLRELLARARSIYPSWSIRLDIV